VTLSKSSLSVARMHVHWQMFVFDNFNWISLHIRSKMFQFTLRRHTACYKKLSYLKQVAHYHHIQERYTFSVLSFYAYVLYESTLLYLVTLFKLR